MTLRAEARGSEEVTMNAMLPGSVPSTNGSELSAATLSTGGLRTVIVTSSVSVRPPVSVTVRVNVSIVPSGTVGAVKVGCAAVGSDSVTCSLSVSAWVPAIGQRVAGVGVAAGAAVQGHFRARVHGLVLAGVSGRRPVVVLHRAGRGVVRRLRHQVARACLQTERDRAVRLGHVVVDDRDGLGEGRLAGREGERTVAVRREVALLGDGVVDPQG